MPARVQANDASIVPVQKAHDQTALHQAFGEDLGHHARSAVGFASLPTGVAVEIEGIFAVDAPVGGRG